MSSQGPSPTPTRTIARGYALVSEIKKWKTDVNVIQQLHVLFLTTNKKIMKHWNQNNGISKARLL